MNEKLVKFIIFFITAAVHIILIFFLVFTAEVVFQNPKENARVMKLTDLDELPPPPPPPLPENSETPQVEEIAETMIETDFVPEQEVVEAGTLTSEESFENYLQIHQVSVAPVFSEDDITAALVYPPIALRTGITGRVILELYVDREGIVQRVNVLFEEPENRGFGDAATKSVLGRKGTPAYANGIAVSCRYRYPVRFVIK